MRLSSLPPVALALLSLAGWAHTANGQGIIVDRRPSIPVARAFEIREVRFDARIRDQIAEVQVSQRFYNPGSVQIDAEYLFPLPEDGAIQNFVLMVDGRELPGRLMPKDEARRIYEDIVRSKRDPALLEYMGQGLYKTSVFPIPPGAEREVTMRYNQVCKRDRDVVEFTYPFATQKFTSKPIDRLSLKVSVESKDAIKSVYCPSHDVPVSRPSDRDARVSYEARNTVPTTDFRLVYTLHEGALGASVLSYKPDPSEDGYFLLLASPQVRRADDRRQPKTVIFVLDRSGSMSGKKIEQARNALKFVLGNLREDDTFNIVVYDDRVETYKPELQRYNDRSRDEAVRFVDNVRPGGSTNIDDALRTSLDLVRDDSRPGYLLFLTDGLPTVGEMKEIAIAEHARSANRHHTRLFAFGVGYDVNARLLDRLSGGNSGTSEYVKPDEDIEAKVARFYSRLTSPVLSSLKLEMAGTDLNRTYPRELPDLFEGAQLVLAGRYRQSGQTTVRLTGKVGGERQTLEFPADLASTGRGNGHDYIAKLWATRRVGDLIDQIDLHGQNKELLDELVALSTKHGILTPYTSFLADERVNLHAAVDNRMRLGRELKELEVVQGSSGVNQRGTKQAYMLADRAAAPAAPLGTVTDPNASGLGQGHGPLGGRSMGNGQESFARRRPLGSMMGGMGGMGGGMGPASGNTTASSYGLPAVVAKDLEGRDQVVSTVRQVGAKTFYRKGNRWVDSAVKPGSESKARQVQLFSDAYFDLARKQSAELNQYLVFNEPVTVELDGVVYNFDPERK